MSDEQKVYRLVAWLDKLANHRDIRLVEVDIFPFEAAEFRFPQSRFERNCIKRGLARGSLTSCRKELLCLRRFPAIGSNVFVRIALGSGFPIYQLPTLRFTKVFLCAASRAE